MILALENIKPSSNLSPQKNETAKHCSPSKKENRLQSRYRVSPGKLPQFKTSTENIASASEKLERNQSSLPDNKDVLVLSDGESDRPVKETNKQTGSTHCPEHMGSSVVKFSSSESIKIEDHADCGRDIPQKEASNCDKANADGTHRPQQIDEEKQCNGDSHKNVESDVDSRSTENVQSVSCNPSPSQNVVDRYYRQKGPRIAKVVRRINCNVEPLDFGSVRGGKLWCDTRAIYPKGMDYGYHLWNSETV